MAHLIASFSSQTHPDLTAIQCRQALQAKHDEICVKAQEAVRAAAEASTSTSAGGWGVAFKRIKVEVDSADGKQPLIEVINQMATVERLLDALTWIGLQAWGAQATVVACHPTTSSHGRKASDMPKAELDHDLVVRVGASQDYWFEVSDVLQPTDGNRKLMKEEISLGIRPKEKDAELKVQVSASVRRFLVTSPEWADHSKLKGKDSCWQKLDWPSGAPDFGTRIWEYKPATT